MPPSEEWTLFRQIVDAYMTLGKGVFRLVRGEVSLRKSLGTHHSGGFGNDPRELADLTARLSRYAETAPQMWQQVCDRVGQRQVQVHPASPLARAQVQLLGGLLLYEGLFAVPQVDLKKKRSTSEMWELTAALKRQLAAFEKPERIEEYLETVLLNTLPECIPPFEDGDVTTSVPLYTLFPDPALAVEQAIGVFLGNEPRSTSPFPTLWGKLEYNWLVFSGIDPDEPEETRPQPTAPTKMKGLGAKQIVNGCLSGTPFEDFFMTEFPFSIPLKARFEHTQIVGGSGHGKT